MYLIIFLIYIIFSGNDDPVTEEHPRKQQKIAESSIADKPKDDQQNVILDSAKSTVSTEATVKPNTAGANTAGTDTEDCTATAMFYEVMEYYRDHKFFLYAWSFSVTLFGALYRLTQLFSTGGHVEQGSMSWLSFFYMFMLPSQLVFLTNWDRIQGECFGTKDEKKKKRYWTTLLSKKWKHMLAYYVLAVVFCIWPLVSHANLFYSIYKQATTIGDAKGFALVRCKIDNSAKSLSQIECLVDMLDNAPENKHDCERNYSSSEFDFCGVYTISRTLTSTDTESHEKKLQEHTRCTQPGAELLRQKSLPQVMETNRFVRLRRDTHSIQHARS